jgi:hypothetical protein
VAGGNDATRPRRKGMTDKIYVILIDTIRVLNGSEKYIGMYLLITSLKITFDS